MAASAGTFSSDRPRPSSDRPRSPSSGRPRSRKLPPAKSIALEQLVRFGAVAALVGVFVRNGRLGLVVAAAVVGSACLIGYLETASSPVSTTVAASTKPTPLPPPRVVAADSPPHAQAVPSQAAPAQAIPAQSRIDDLLSAPQTPVARPKPIFTARDPAIDRWFMKAYLRCWTPPTPLPQDDQYAAKIRMTYNADGTTAAAPTLVNPPSNPEWRPFADSALRAVAKCSPLKIPAQYQDHFDQWNKMSLYFSPDSAG
jgi:hypothetical protein